MLELFLEESLLEHGVLSRCYFAEIMSKLFKVVQNWLNILLIKVRPSDKATLTQANLVLNGDSNKHFFAKLLPFLGPAFIASVAYIDPGNFATNIQGGARFGYLLLWVITVSNLIAMLVQSLSAKLGIASGKNLAQLCREEYPTPVVILMWFVAELVAMATDLAEFLGAALGFEMLFGIPLWLGAILAALCTLLILSLERYGFRPIEAVITSLLSVVAFCYVLETFLVRPKWASIVYHAFVPIFAGSESVFLAAGILGATIMPHVIFLHSALTQGRIITRDETKLIRLYRYELVDIVIALGLAGFVNAAILVMSASTFHNSASSNVASIEEAYLTLSPLFGKASSWIFAVSLLVSGLSSSAVGTMAGQIVMKGFLKLDISVFIRRLVTMSPAIIVIILGIDPTKALVLSQVLLSFGIPFALIPLISFTSNKKIMGVLVNRFTTKVLAILIAMLIVTLNIFLIYQALWE